MENGEFSNSETAPRHPVGQQLSTVKPTNKLRVVVVKVLEIFNPAKGLLRSLCCQVFMMVCCLWCWELAVVILKVKDFLCPPKLMFSEMNRK